MDETLFWTETGDAFYGFRAPVSTYISEDLCLTGELITKQHTYCVQAIVFGGKNIWRANTIPIVGGIQHRFHKIAVR